MEQHVWDKTIVYTRAFQRTHMSRREAGVLYCSCFILAMVYSFPAFWFPPPFLIGFIDSQHPLFNKMGYHCHLPRSLVFDPHAMGGVGLCNLIHEQCSQQMINLV